MSAKNVTVYMPAETAEKMQMDQFKETNWSKIARDAIEKYINDKTQTTLPIGILERLRNEMDYEYSNGRKFAFEVLADQLTYRSLSNFFETSAKRAEEKAEEFASDNGLRNDEVSPNYDGTAKEMIRSNFSAIPKDVSSKFIDGVYDLLKEIWKSLKEGMKNT